MADLSVYGKVKGFNDYQEEAAKNSLATALAQAQIQAAQAKAIKDAQPDLEEIGKAAFLKAAQGQPLSEQEKAGLLYLDNKTQTMAFNPVTGAMEQKPSLLDRAGIAPGAAPAAALVAPAGGAMYVPPRNMSPREARNAPMTPDQASQVVDLFDPSGAPVNDAPAEISPKSEWDIAFEKELAAAAGNPRLQQTIKENYAKSKISMNESEARNAGFADRMLNSNPIVEQTTEAARNPTQKVLNSIPLLGNYVVSGNYQSFSQAQRDFINAQLRRESGAVISPSEFDNAERQYFPTPGDTDETIAQKKANRDAAVRAMQRSAGAAYKPTIIKPVTPAQKANANSVSKIPMKAVQALRADPTLADEFDAKYGGGAAQRVLGKK